MKKRIILVVIVLDVIVAALFCALYYFNHPPFDPADFEHLRTPAITEKPDQKVIQVTLEGDPDQTSGPAIGLLYEMLFALRSDHEGIEMVAPRARWPSGLETKRSKWVGQFALPVPDSVTALPDGIDTSAGEVRLTTWSYGSTAEILHQGSYDSEKPTIEQLETYIIAQGYEIAGPHEEEYVKGPGMFFTGDPAGYHTVIRYQVRKQPPATP